MNRQAKIFRRRVIAFFVVITLFANFAVAKYSGGSGDPNDPYQIANVADLMTLANDVNDYNKCFILTADIDLDPDLPGGQVFTTAVIAPDTNSSSYTFQGTAFTGSFDGNSKKIMNLRIYTAGANNHFLGLFGYIDGSAAQVKNLGIDNAVISGGSISYFRGGLCGRNDSGTISNCYATGQIIGGEKSVSLGGLCGLNSSGTISNCCATGQITGGTGSYLLSGLCGYNYYGTISNCYATCNVTGGNNSEYLGGLCGKNESGTISNCYATGSVPSGDGSTYVGGLCGENESGTISNCYATGSASGDHELGGLCGGNSGTISNSYVTGQVTSVADSYYTGGLCGYNSNIISNCYATGQVTGRTGSRYLGGLCGYNTSSIIHCYAAGSVSGDSYLGGLCGLNSYGTISNCYATSQVTGGISSYPLGGLCGYNYSGTISNCYAIGSVSGYRLVGGLCGYNYSGTISNCYAKGQVTGGTNSYDLGGLCGYNSSSSVISNCYSTGFVNGYRNVGGFCGTNYGSVTGCFWDTQTSGMTTSEGGTGLTTAQMQTQSTFTAAGWDFVGEIINGTEDIWWMVENSDYPKLSWSPLKYSGGSGEPNDPYQIATAEDLSDIGNHIEDFNKCFVITADIDLAGYGPAQFKIIGPNSTTPFTGVLDGNNKTVRNFTYDSNGQTIVGMFGVINSADAVILDVCLDNPSVIIDSGTFPCGGALAGSLANGLIQGCRISGGNITGLTFTGGLIGKVSGGLIKDCNVVCTVTGTTEVGGITGKNDGQITNCCFDGNVFGLVRIGGIAGINTYCVGRCSSKGVITVVNSPNTRYCAGGIAGENTEGATICYCSSSAAVTGAEWMGGLVGYNYRGEIYECYANGNVSGSDLLGGLVGNNSSGNVTNCYAQGSVSGNAAIGGLIGNNENYDSSKYVKHCYSTGSVSGSDNVGGLIGYDDNYWGNFEKCFWNQTVNPSLAGIGNSTDANVIGKTTAEMKTKSTFTDAVWDFVWETANGPNDVWAICEGVSYPKLAWQYKIGDSDSDKDVDFIDFASLGNKWLQADSTLYCGGNDLTGDGLVDLDDLDAFAENWLQ